MTTTTKRVWRYGALAAAGAFLLTSCGQGDSQDENGSQAGDEDQEVTLTIASPSASETQTDLQEWMELVTEHSGGSIQFEDFYDGSLCSTTEINSCVSDGRADIGRTSASYHPSEFPITRIGELSFQTNDLQAQALAMHDLYDQSDEMQEEFGNQNQRILYFSPVGPHVLASPSEMSSLEELEGLEIRSTGGQSTNLSALGASPVAISPAEVYEALDRGVLDAASFPLELADNNSIPEVAPYLHDTGEHTEAMIIMHWSMNQETYDNLSADQQQAIDEASAEVVSGIVEEHIKPTTENVCQRLIDAGAEFPEIGDEEEAAQWREDALPPQLEEWKSAAGDFVDADEFYDTYQQLLSEHETGEEQTPAQICRSLQ